MKYFQSVKKGRGAQINSSNKFLALSKEIDPIEFEESEEFKAELKTQFFIENPKNVISKIESPDLPISFSINPYQGCEHGCVYCYARNSHEYWGFSAGLDFESKIMVKQNAPQLLEQAFNKKNWYPSVIELSGNTDCYQPAEKKFMLTRKLLEVFLKYRNPVGIITKNALIVRDLDILAELAKLNLVHVYISITTLEEDLRQKLEPRTVTASQRLKIIEKLSLEGVPTGVMTAPIIPGLNNHEIPNIIKFASENGALNAGYTVVRLNGAIGQVFENWIRQAFPDKADKVLNQIKECHGGDLNNSEWGTRIVGKGNFAENIKQLHEMARKKYFNGKKMPDFDNTLFRRNGQAGLFD